jgi:hypothetical protein
VRSSVLRRLAQGPPPRDEVERCDLCGEPLPAEHRHLLDLATGRAECACRACALLFDRGEAGGGHYRLIPQRRRRLAGFDADGRLLAALGIPVDLVFVTVTGATGEAVARYPSPIGLTTHVPAPDAWQHVAAAEPALAGLEPDVEALLIRRGHDGWLLPIDDCFRLAALLREHWAGFRGGDAVWAEIARFFAQLEEEETACR